MTTNTICLACTGNTIVPGAKHQDCTECSYKFRHLIVGCTVCNCYAIAGDTFLEICIFCHLQSESTFVEEHEGIWDWDLEDFVYGEVTLEGV
jgi:hypothetical protein